MPADQRGARRLPPFGRELAEARRRGLVPKLPLGWFVVALGWDLAKGQPRIVLPSDKPVDGYDLAALAGLDLIIAYCRHDAHRVQAVADALLAIRPRTLTACAVGTVAVPWHYWHAPGATLLVGLNGA